MAQTAMSFLHKRQSCLIPPANRAPGNMDLSYFLDSRFRGNDTLGLVHQGEPYDFLRLKYCRELRGWLGRPWRGVYEPLRGIDLE